MFFIMIRRRHNRVDSMELSTGFKMPTMDTLEKEGSSSPSNKHHGYDTPNGPTGDAVAAQQSHSNIYVVPDAKRERKDE